MPKLAQYCKAYRIKDLQKFPGWQAGPAAGERSGGLTDLPDTAVVFLQQDFTVTAGIARDEDVLLETTGPAWIAYCREALNFEVPAWCQEPAAQAKS